MTTRAHGRFDVKLAPLTLADGQADPSLGRMSLDKRFEGDLDATSKGEMLSAMSGVPGSAGYVAIERVTGTLHGRPGAFTLQHTGTMDRGRSGLAITVVPDSGTGELTGLSGGMSITIVGKEHSYDLDYTLAPTPA